ncbi:MAG TPA: transglycosylase domain-containing protein [Candidatus Limnocylindria bacterium]|nr:transglycosylase domain-containing protein [Candidatus Limnocylindria bacterium]
MPPRRTPIRLSATARALLHAKRTRPAPGRVPIGRIALTVALAAIVATGSIAGIGAVIGVGVIGSLANGLPDPANLASLTFSQPTIVYDRTGTVELARFEREKRDVVAFTDVPRLVLDATIAAEDRTFWDNDGYDPAAILAAAVQNASSESDVERGASTITQQLVRARLLPAEVIDDEDRYLRKVLEILQAARLTAAFPGEAGKQQIITAYLNEIYYGHRAYGIAAAAEIYFGVDITDLTPAQAALLAGLAKAPSVYDPYRYAVEDAEGQLVVADDAPPIARRNYVLLGLAESRWTRLTPAQLEAALEEPVILAGDKPRSIRAPHFSWAVHKQLEQLLGGRDAVETGGYRVITTLDWDAQKIAERYLTAGAILPNMPAKQLAKLMEDMRFSKADRSWIRALKGKDIHNGSLVALDYRKGDVLAYAGSAGYYRDDLASPEFQPEHDAAASYRQPGSAFKPIVYATAFEKRVLTPASLLLDISTDFGGGWAPHNADELERGPVLVRNAIQQSLNLPAIRALERVGVEPVADVAADLGLTFPGGRTTFLQAGLAGAIGTVETRPIELTSAFGSFGNGGLHVPTRMILSIKGPDGSNVYRAPEPDGTQAVSKEAAFLITDILAGNTDPRENRWWSLTLGLRGPDGERRPAAAKTGTADNRRDFSTYGYLAPPEDPDAPALAVGVWMGNSDHSAPNSRVHATSLTAAGEVWHAFTRDYSKDWPVADFKAPKDVVQANADRWSGGKPGPWTSATVREWFIDGTQPGAKKAVDQAGLLYTRGCGVWQVNPVAAELGPRRWDDDVADWTRRARRGAGVRGEYGSVTAYWPGSSSWGGPLAGPCPKPDKLDEPDDDDKGPDKPKPPKPDETDPPPPPPDDDATELATAATTAPTTTAARRRRALHAGLRNKP